MPIWSYLGLRKLSSERLYIQSWFKGWKSFYTSAKNADVFYDIVDFFCALKHCSELSISFSSMLLLKIRTGLNPGNEARPINPFPIPLFHFLALVSFLALPEPVFLCSESKRKRLLRRLFQMFRCSRKFSARTTRPKKPCFILIYLPTGLSGTFL